MNKKTLNLVVLSFVVVFLICAIFIFTKKDKEVLETTKPNENLITENLYSDYPFYIGEIFEDEEYKELVKKVSGLFDDDIKKAGYQLTLGAKNLTVDGKSYFLFNLVNNHIIVFDGIAVEKETGHMFFYKPDKTIDTIELHEDDVIILDNVLSYHTSKEFYKVNPDGTKELIPYN